MMPIDWSGKKEVSLYESRTFYKLSSTQLFWLLRHCFSIFWSLFRHLCELHRVPKDNFITGQLNTVRKGSLDKEKIFCVRREVNYEREEGDLPKTLTAMYISIQNFYSARTKKLFKKTVSTFIRLLILELNLLN